MTSLPINPNLITELITRGDAIAITSLIQQFKDERDRAEAVNRGYLGEIARLNRVVAHVREHPGAPQDQTPKVYVEQRKKAAIPTIRKQSPPAAKPNTDINLDDL